MIARFSMILAVVAALLLLASGGGYGYYCYKYPHGYNHCCDSQLSFLLREYADRHNGNFPSGGGSPEASLSLVHHDAAKREAPELLDSVTHLLAGKARSGAEAHAVLQQGGNLAPDQCDWHYVEGLHVDDPGDLALFWDKIGSGHHGERLPEGGHTVSFLNFGREWIPKEDWADFLAAQDALRAECLAKRRLRATENSEK